MNKREGNRSRWEEISDHKSGLIPVTRGKEELCSKALRPQNSSEKVSARSKGRSPESQETGQHWPGQLFVGAASEARPQCSHGGDS